MTLDKKLVRLRKREGLSQAEVSEKLDVSRQAVSRWESGEAKPSTDNLQTLCKLYYVSLDYLLNESEDESPVPTSADLDTKRGKEREEQKKGRQWIRGLVIGTIVLGLLVSCLFWYRSSQMENGMDLHSIQGEDRTSSEVPKFNLDWE